ncbi:MAG TPA: aldolase/citrate lyase family protein [Vicinamibacterales bacterium]|nr:aldolase/citrate lyase family protein [Vicinamibacterales bacterium]
MRNHLYLGLAGTALLTGLVVAQVPTTRLNPVIELLEQKKPVFGLYAPSNRRPGGPGGPGAPAGRPGAAPPVTPAPAAAPTKTPAELAQEAVAYKHSDFVFDGSMEGGLERALPAFTELVAAMHMAGALSKSPHRLTHPLIVKTPELDEPTIHADIARQLNLGVSGLMLPTAESGEQVRRAIAAMRFKSHSGTRPDTVGNAPAFWGMSEQEYKQRADVWPLNPRGELINWTIIESKEGLAKVREIAAVKGVGVLWPGAGTLRGLFTTTNAAGERTFDEKSWEAAIQTVASACKEFNVACGFPANEKDIEMRMKQGFSVFVMNWGDGGFRTVEAGRRLSNRPTH